MSAQPLLTLQNLSTRYAVHRTTIWRWVRAGRLPQPVNLGGASPRWDPSTLPGNNNAH